MTGRERADRIRVILEGGGLGTHDGEPLLPTGSVVLVPDEAERVREALRTWGTDWYGPNPEYKPLLAKAREALALLL